MLSNSIAFWIVRVSVWAINCLLWRVLAHITSILKWVISVNYGHNISWVCHIFIWQEYIIYTRNVENIIRSRTDHSFRMDLRIYNLKTSKIVLRVRNHNLCSKSLKMTNQTTVFKDWTSSSKFWCIKQRHSSSSKNAWFDT